MDSSGLPLITAAGDQLTPALAPTGSGYLLAWGDGRSGGSQIYSTRVSPEGSPLDGTGLRLSTTTANHFWPRVAVSSSGALLRPVMRLGLINTEPTPTSVAVASNGRTISWCGK
jgi:hypothetical protein